MVSQHQSTHDRELARNESSIAKKRVPGAGLGRPGCGPRVPVAHAARRASTSTTPARRRTGTSHFSMRLLPDLYAPSVREDTWATWARVGCGARAADRLCRKRASRNRSKILARFMSLIGRAHILQLLARFEACKDHWTVQLQR